jgi:hypothetical protein
MRITGVSVSRSRNCRTISSTSSSETPWAKRPLGRPLDDRTVGDGIGEGHAQLDQIHAGGHHRVHQRNGHGGRRITGGDEGYERGATPVAKLLEACGDSTHKTNPS